MTPILDANGQVTGKRYVEMEDLKSGRMLWLNSTDATIGQWDAAKLDQFTDTVHVLVKHVASQTQTPIHYIMGELGNVNGETLTATELPLATKVRSGHKFLSTPMRRVFALMAQVRGNRQVAEQVRSAVTQWRNPETMSDAQVSDAATKDNAIGWPFAAVLERRYGLSQPEIQRVMKQAEYEAVNDPELQLARDLANGTTPGNA